MYEVDTKQKRPYSASYAQICSLSFNLGGKGNWKCKEEKFKNNNHDTKQNE
jgi:hypothetical protein